MERNERHAGWFPLPLRKIRMVMHCNASSQYIETEPKLPGLDKFPQAWVHSVIKTPYFLPGCTVCMNYRATVPSFPEDGRDSQFWLFHRRDSWNAILQTAWVVFIITPQRGSASGARAGVSRKWRPEGHLMECGVFSLPSLLRTLVSVSSVRQVQGKEGQCVKLRGRRGFFPLFFSVSLINTQFCPLFLFLRPVSTQVSIRPAFPR